MSWMIQSNVPARWALALVALSYLAAWALGFAWGFGLAVEATG